MPQICRIIDHSCNLSVVMKRNETNAADIVNFIHTSVQSFINSSSDFQILKANEQLSISIRNFPCVTIFCFIINFHNEFINNESKYIHLFTTIYGSDILLQAKQINKELINNSVIIKIMLIIFIFSSNCSMVNIQENLFDDGFLYDTHSLFIRQNIYVELLWKFMIFNYDYYESILCFSRFIGLFLNLIKYSGIAYENNAIYHMLVENVFHKAKSSFITNQNKQVRLWINRPNESV